MRTRIKVKENLRPDLSSQAIDRRLKDVGQLYQVGSAFKSLIKLGSVEGQTSLETVPSSEHSF